MSHGNFHEFQGQIIQNIFAQKEQEIKSWGLGFLVQISDVHFSFKKNNNCKQAFCYHSDFHLYQNSALQPVQKILPSLKSGFPLAFSREVCSHGTILLSLSYILISRQFTE